ncbi:MAG: tRNA (mnm(5)s(2)U34)-methyltransferase [Peptococcaceae bacterium]
MSQSINTIRLLQQSLQLSNCNGGFCIDATMGKGHDTLFLAELVGAEGRVLAMDVQPAALEATRTLLQKHQMDQRVQLVLDGHEHMGAYAAPETVDAVMFNLGYLPGGDHSIATKAETTIAALEQSLQLLKPLGMISLAIYHGGDTGFAERDAVLDWLKQLDHKRYTVLVTDFYNRPNYPPLAVQIIKEKQK